MANKKTTQTGIQRSAKPCDVKSPSLDTVRVPDTIRPIFEKAQQYVSQYFSERIEDPKHSSIRISGERYILVRAASMSVEFVDLVASLYKDREKNEAQALAYDLLFDVAHAIGKADARAFSQKMCVTDPLDKLSAGPVHFSYAGWAFVDIHPESKPSPDDNYYLIYDHPYSFESDSWIHHKRKSEMPVCIMNAGYSSGWCEESFGLPLVSTEVECRASGGDHCRFIMAPPSRIEAHLEHYFQKQEKKGKSHSRKQSLTVAIPEFFQRKRMEDELLRANQELEVRVMERTKAASLAIEEMKREAVEREYGEKLQSALFRIAHQATAAQDLKELYVAIHGIISELMYAKNMYIALFDAETDIVSFPYYVDEEDLAPPRPRKRGHGITEYVLRTGEPLLATPDVLDVLENNGEVDRIGAPSLDWMGVPLKRGNIAYGILALQTYEENIRYGEKEKDILVFVSQQIASAIENKQRDEVLRKSEERYRTLFQSAVHGIFRSTPDGTFLYVNPAFVHMLGYDTEEEVLALDLKKDVYVDSEDRARVLEEVLHYGKISNIETRWKKRDGSIITVRSSGRVIRENLNQPAILEAFVEDVTEHRLLEERLRQAQKMEAVGRLAGGVAHDFNNLLTVMQGYSELLLDDLPKDGKHHAEVREIKNAADRAAALTNQLLSFSRQQVLLPKVLDMNHVIQSMENLMRRLLTENMELRTTLSSELGSIKADVGQLEQIIMNLAVNARDAMPNGGTLHIATTNAQLDEIFTQNHIGSVPGNYVVLEVRDTGLGMDPETISKIFEPFFTTKPAGKGTGLGLATVYGIVKQSNGYIDVYSETDRGTSFKLYFPRVETASASITSETDTIELTRGTETILLVEDEEGVRAIVTNILSRQGYRILPAPDAQEALAISQAETNKIHLLLSDIGLKQMNGRELSEKIIQQRKDIKVMFMSGYTDDQIVHDGVWEQNTVFLQKPFNSVELLRLVRKTLDI